MVKHVQHERPGFDFKYDKETKKSVLQLLNHISNPQESCEACTSYEGQPFRKAITDGLGGAHLQPQN